jgi:hypothetical protein
MVAKSLFGMTNEISRAADAFYARPRRSGEPKNIFGIERFAVR